MNENDDSRSRPSILQKRVWPLAGVEWILSTLLTRLIITRRAGPIRRTDVWAMRIHVDTDVSVSIINAHKKQQQEKRFAHSNSKRQSVEETTNRRAMKWLLVFCVVAGTILTCPAEASVFLPSTSVGSIGTFDNHNSLKRLGFRDIPTRERRIGRSSRSNGQLAMAIPGNGVAEQVFVGGFGNFLSIYNNVITLRIVLTWIPQAQGVGALQPLYAITDPFLNLFRGVIPPIFGLDLSPIAAFFLLNVLTNATAAAGVEMPLEMKARMKTKRRALPLMNLKTKPLLSQ